DHRVVHVVVGGSGQVGTQAHPAQECADVDGSGHVPTRAAGRVVPEPPTPSLVQPPDLVVAVTCADAGQHPVELQRPTPPGHGRRVLAVGVLVDDVQGD